jgi:predicted peptidase
VNDFSNFSLTEGGVVALPGRLFIPPEAANPGTPRPLILFLHGGGENGTNNISQINSNIDNLLAEAKRRGAYLYAPQTTNNWTSTLWTDRVATMIDRAITDENVDAGRLYVTGLSNGGGGTWNMLSRHPDLFAAGVPICGVSPASDFVPTNLVDQAIAAFHARNDNVVANSISRNVINSILAAGDQSAPLYPAPLDPDFSFASSALDLRYTEYAFGGHTIWTRIYQSPQMYEWLFAHTTAVPEPAGVTLLIMAAITLGIRRHRHW